MNSRPNSNIDTTGGGTRAGNNRVALRPGLLTLNVRGLCGQNEAEKKISHALNVLARGRCCLVSLVDTKLKDADALRRLVRRVCVIECDTRCHRPPWLARQALCAPGSSAGGVALLVDRGLEPFLAEVERFGDRVLLQWLRGRGRRKLLVVAAYLPHDRLEAAAIGLRVTRVVARELRKGCSVIVMGDLNTQQTINASLVRGLCDRGLVDVADHAGDTRPTRFPEGQQYGEAHRLDYILVTADLLGSGLAPTCYSLDKVLCGTPAPPLSQAHGGDTPRRQPTLDHAAVMVTGLPTLSRFFDKGEAVAFMAALKEGRRRLPCWVKASPNQRVAFVARVQQAMVVSSFDVAVAGGDVEAAWREFSEAIGCAASILPFRIVGGRVSDRPVAPGGKVDRFTTALSALAQHKARRYQGTLDPTCCNTLADIGFLAQELAVLTAPATAVPMHARTLTARQAEDALHAARARYLAASNGRRIRETAEARNGRFASDPGSVIRSVLGRTRRPTSIDHYNITTMEGTVESTSDPAGVKRAVADEVAEWFSDLGPVDLESASPFWRQAFAPVTHLEGDVWEGLMAPLTSAEVEQAFRCSALDKAAGDTGWSLRLYKAVYLACPHYFMGMANLVLAQRRMPKQWRHGAVCLIPKTTGGFTGTAATTRPITLLDTMSKLVMKALLARVNKVLTKHQVLVGARHSGVPGTDTTTPIAVLNAAAAQARASGRQLWVLFEDKSKAFDSIPHDLLRLALQRVKLPEAFIEFYCSGCLAGRTAHVLTAFGPSSTFPVARGIPQGAVESPLMWNVFYDVCLTAVHNLALANRASPPPIPLPDPIGHRGVVGVELVAAAGMARQNGVWSAPLRTLAIKIVAGVAYMDDLALYANSGEELQEAADLVASFNALARIRANPAKGAVLALNPPPGGRVAVVSRDLAGAVQDVPWVPASGFRYLGVWIDSNMSGKVAVTKAVAEVVSAAKTLRRRMVPAKLAAYLVNAVVAPAFLYRTRACIPPLHVLEALDAKLRAIVRRALGRAKGVSNPALHCRHLLGLGSLVDAVVHHHVTELVVALNSPATSESAVATKVVVGHLQHATRCIVSPLEDPALALRAWRPDPTCPVTWLDNLLPVMASSRLSIRDTCGEFDLSPLGSHPMADAFPWFKVATTLSMPARYMKMPWHHHLHANTSYTLEQLLGSHLLHSTAAANPRAIAERRGELTSVAANTGGTDTKIAAATAAAITAGPYPFPRRVRRGVTASTSGDSVAPLHFLHNAWVGAARTQMPRSAGDRLVLAYTDGSFAAGAMAPLTPPTRSMTGAGCTLPQYGIEACAELPPAMSSSTRAELGGALLAALVAPDCSLLLVLSDSMAMVRASRRMLGGQATPRKLVRVANADLWLGLRQVASMRCFSIVMRWVRGHAGNSNNERADALARLATDVARAEERQAGALVPMAAQLHLARAPVSGDPRRFLVGLADELWLARLAGNRRAPPSIAAALPSVNWRATGYALHSEDGPRGWRVSTAANAATRFRLRVLCGVIPSASSMVRVEKATSDKCTCGEVDDAEHWVACTDSAADKMAAITALARHLHATACTSRAVASEWAHSLMRVATAATLVTEADIEWFKSRVAGPALGRWRRGVTVAKMVASAVHHASLALQGVWRAHALRLADARAAGLPTDTPPCLVQCHGVSGPGNAAATALPAQAYAAVPPPRGRCSSCLVVNSKHSPERCLAHAAALDRVAALLCGAPPSLTPGFAHAGSLA
jgi:ribonuclease HI